MTRSIDALERRAAKRSISVKEQKRRDDVRGKNYKVVKQKNETSKINWTCKKCLNENFPERVECNRCGAAQDVEAKCYSEQGKRNKTEIDKKIRRKKPAEKKNDKDQKQWPKQAPGIDVIK